MKLSSNISANSDHRRKGTIGENVNASAGCGTAPLIICVKTLPGLLMLKQVIENER